MTVDTTFEELAKLEEELREAQMKVEMIQGKMNELFFNMVKTQKWVDENQTVMSGINLARAAWKAGKASIHT